MTVQVDSRAVVLIGRDSRFPAPIAFYLGHELGHLLSEGAGEDDVIVDLGDLDAESAANDDEERAADEFALALLTGERHPIVVSADGNRRAHPKELARVATAVASDLQIEPGVLAQCYGYSTKDWPTATASMKYIYGTGVPAWQEVNAVARRLLRLKDLPVDAFDFLDAVLGPPE